MGFQPLPDSVSPSEVTLDPTVLDDKPEIASAVARVIGHWSQIDLQLVFVVAGFLDADFRVAADMLNAIQNSGARRDAIDAAARRALSDKPDDLRLFRAVVQCVSSTRSMRNAYAHWLWGKTPKLKDKLVLVEPNATAAVGAELISLLIRPGQGISGKDARASLPAATVEEVMSRQRERYHIVGAADVERDIRDAAAASSWMSGLLKVLVWGRAQPDVAAVARPQLLAVHQILEAYDKLSPTQNSP